MIEWIKGTLVAEGMVSEKDLDLIQVVDTAEEAVNLVLHGHVRPPSTNGDQRPE
jgi:predicted Rossmann-fold nucleotide-binding protein